MAEISWERKRVKTEDKCKVFQKCWVKSRKKEKEDEEKEKKRRNLHNWFQIYNYWNKMGTRLENSPSNQTS